MAMTDKQRAELSQRMKGVAALKKLNKERAAQGMGALDKLPEGQNEATIASGPTREPSSAGAKVVVANRLPMGLRIRNHKMVSFLETDRNGMTKDVPVAEALPGEIFVHGTAVPYNRQPRCRILNGYAFTEDVDKDSYDAWLKDNRGSQFVINQLVFAESSFERALNRAKENETRITNMEPMNPDGDPRAPEPMAGMDPISTERIGNPNATPIV